MRRSTEYFVLASIDGLCSTPSGKGLFSKVSYLHTDSLCTLLFVSTSGLRVAHVSRISFRLFFDLRSLFVHVWSRALSTVAPAVCTLFAKPTPVSGPSDSDPPSFDVRLVSRVSVPSPHSTRPSQYASIKHLSRAIAPQDRNLEHVRFDGTDGRKSIEGRYVYRERSMKF